MDQVEFESFVVCAPWDRKISREGLKANSLDANFKHKSLLLHVCRPNTIFELVLGNLDKVSWS